MIPYTKEAYEVKKYAFVSDYARFWILYNYGGLYFDTDVEVIKPMDEIIARGPFMGCEYEGAAAEVSVAAPGQNLGVNPGLGLGVPSGFGLYKEILDLYATLSFYKADGSYNQKTIVTYTTEILCKYGLKDVNKVQECAGIWVYTKEYLSPMKGHNVKFTSNTVSVHHYMCSWRKRNLRNILLWIYHSICFFIYKSIYCR